MKIQRHEGKKILIIDDDRELNEFYQSQLSMRGYEVRSTASGLEGIELLKAEKFNLIILDLRMPLLDGLGTLDRLKTIRPDIEVIMNSGQGDIDAAVEAMKKGAVDFIQKPVRMEELIILIERLLDRQQARSLISLYEASQKIFSPIKTDLMFESVVGHLGPLFQCHETALVIRDDNDVLAVAASRGVAEDKVGWVAEFACKAIAQAAQQSMPYVMDGNYLVAILRSAQSVFGALYLFRPDRLAPFNSKELQEVMSFAAQISHLFQNLVFYGRLEKNITHLKRAQEELTNTKSTLQEKEKLANLGLMVSGMAHEINNPLAAVMGYVDLLLQTSHVELGVRDQLNIVLREAQRCREMVEDMLLYSRPRKPKFQKTDLRGVIREVVEVMRFELENDLVDVETSVSDGAGVIEVDASQMKQVFLNMVRNACHALRRREKNRRVWIEIHSVDAQTVRIRIRDNGPGIAPEIRSKLFQPFISTKANSIQGTGLGLSNCRMIVEEHGGKIRVLDSPSEGAWFEIELPVHHE